MRGELVNGLLVGCFYWTRMSLDLANLSIFLAVVLDGSGKSLLRVLDFSHLLCEGGLRLRELRFEFSNAVFVR